MSPGWLRKETRTLDIVTAVGRRQPRAARCAEPWTWLPCSRTRPQSPTVPAHRTRYRRYKLLLAQAKCSGRAATLQHLASPNYWKALAAVSVPSREPASVTSNRCTGRIAGQNHVNLVRCWISWRARRTTAGRRRGSNMHGFYRGCSSRCRRYRRRLHRAAESGRVSDSVVPVRMQPKPCLKPAR